MGVYVKENNRWQKVKIYSKEAPAPVIGGLQDLATYTETDVTNDLTVTSSKVTFDTLQRDSESRLIYDFGEGFWSGDFELRYESEITAMDDQAVVYLVLTTVNGPLADVIIEDVGAYIFRSRVGGNRKIQIGDWENGVSDLYQTGGSTWPHYWNIFKRVGTTLTLQIYSDSYGGTLVDTLTANGAPTTAYRYLYAVSARDVAPVATPDISGYFQNFDVIRSQNLVNPWKTITEWPYHFVNGRWRRTSPPPLPPTGFYNDVINYSGILNLHDATEMEYTPGATGTEEIFTIAAWIRFYQADKTEQQIINAGQNNQLTLTAGDKLQFRTDSGNLITTTSFRDFTAWYNIVVGVDTTQATAANRVKMYVNGGLVTAYDTETYMDKDEVTDFFSTNTHYIGRDEAGAGGAYLSAYIAEFAFIDGTQYSASDFGEFKYGIWIPKDITGLTYGTRGSLLQFGTSDALGTDTSGNVNNWTPTNMTTHQSVDTPEDVYCIYDDTSANSTMHVNAAGGLNPGNTGTNWRAVYGTMGLHNGKWYWEIDVGADTSKVRVGILDCMRSPKTRNTLYELGANAWDYAIEGDNGGVLDKYTGGVDTATDLSALSANDILMVAFDADNNKIWFGKNGSWADSGDPAAGTNAAFDSTDGIDISKWVYMPAISVYQHSTSITNFGATSFTYTPPTGFNNSVKRANLTDNTDLAIPQRPTDFFKAITYEGDAAASREFSDWSFQPDLVTFKNLDHVISANIGDPWHSYDSTRGETNYISQSIPNASAADATGLQSFDNDGFTIGSHDSVNRSGDTIYVGCWKKSFEAGFDIVKYVGTGSAQTIDHNLGVKPELLLVKNLTVARGWQGYSWSGLTGGEFDYTTPEKYAWYADTATGWIENTVFWNDAPPTSTQFTVGSFNNSNENGSSYIAYLFRSVPGVSKFFHYTGNGGRTGPKDLGFKPAYLMMVRMGGTENGVWSNYIINPNSNDGTTNYIRWSTDVYILQADQMMFTSTGFHFTGSGGGNVNGNNAEYFGFAYAGVPSKWGNASP